MKELLYQIKWFVHNIRNFITLKYRHVKYGKNLHILGSIMIRGKGSIEIGDNVTINSCIDANPIGGDTKTVFYIPKEGKLIIGNNVGISNTAIYSEKCVKIGNNVRIGNSCKIYDSNFHSLVLKERLGEKKEGVKKSPVVLEDGVFIGAHSIILKGVTIGKNSIVGAGSVVVKDIPANEIWGGNPAAFIKDIGD